MAKKNLYIQGEETMDMREAFEVYYNLGEKRSMGEVAKIIGKNKATVARYSRSFNWTKRVKDRDEKVHEAIAQKSIETNVLSKVAYRSMIRELVEEAKVMIADGKLKIRNILDLERVMRLDFELMQMMDDVDKDTDDEDQFESLIGAIKEATAELRDEDEPIH